MLRTKETIQRFKSVAPTPGQTSPLLVYFGTLLTRGKLNGFESAELAQLVLQQNKKHLLDNWLKEVRAACALTYMPQALSLKLIGKIEAAILAKLGVVPVVDNSSRCFQSQRTDLTMSTLSKCQHGQDFQICQLSCVFERGSMLRLNVKAAPHALLARSKTVMTTTTSAPFSQPQQVA